ncbi:MAG: right-handed parallel beta-helix repeat-containing protein [Saprospiraceae bacterium]|nr:right-handed parallel beta-helix repeat-containing protein [Saprospiraceae bacterium]
MPEMDICKKITYWATGLLMVPLGASGQEILRALEPGMVINHSVKIQTGVYELPGADSPDQPVLVIEGEGTVVDFQGATLSGNTQRNRPDQFRGLAIYIRNGNNITVKNLKIRGYKVALMAVGVTGLQLENCNFSYNYRQRLYSLREREDLSDWLSYHQNEKDEWLRYGAAIYLKQCKSAVVRGVTVTGGQNGIMMTRCNDGLFYNNSIHFNSGIGIGLYRSSRNRILDNRLDWNVRGYSHGFYSRGQDSAALLCYEQSNDNTFAYNSATHSGDGFFLWAGQTTMDTGEGGCNSNLIHSNDFSHSPTNGIEVTFSSNTILRNRIEDCTYGIWGGYSWQSLIGGNYLANNKFGIAIEHGQENFLMANELVGNETGVQLWERLEQPGDWGYAINRDIKSRNYTMNMNLFDGNHTPLRIAGTDHVAINDNNTFLDFKELLVAEKPNDQFFFVKNDVYQLDGWKDAEAFRTMNRQNKPEVFARDKERIRSRLQRYNTLEKGPPSEPDAINASLPKEQARGRAYILVNEWGPYDFRSPVIWLRGVEKDLYTFSLYAPAGNWRITGSEGFGGFSKMSGSFPDTLRVSKLEGAEILNINLEYTGAEITTPFGEVIPAGTPVTFRFNRYEKTLDWHIRHYAYGEASDPLKNEAAFQQLKTQKPLFEQHTGQLAGRWWGSPAAGVPADQFATFATTEFTATPGRYRITVTSDDGLRLYIDGKRHIDRWTVHEPIPDEIEIDLSGHHKIEIEHFEAGGLGTLDFRIERI